MTWGMVVVLILMVLFFLGGLLLALLALWDLRIGENKHAFLIKALIGILLLVLAVSAPTLGGAMGLGVEQASSNATGSSSTSQP